MPPHAEPHTRVQHSPLEDAQAYLLGTAMCALGLHFLTHIGLVTGQTAGLGVLASYVTGWSFGPVFFVLNLPFYLLAWLRMGIGFTLRSLLNVGLLSVLSELFPALIPLGEVNAPLGAALAGGMIGLGLMVIFRHGASLGGIGILALYLQDRVGFQAGWTQLAFDVALFGVSFAVLDTSLVLWSLLGAVVTNLIIAVNHRADRYVGR